VDDPSVQGSIDETFYNYLNNRVIDTLRAGIDLGEEELREEFQRYSSQYKKPLELNLARIVVSSEAEGKQVVRKLERGEPFTRVLRNHTINSEDLMTDGELGFQSVRKLGPMAPKVKDLQPGQVGGPYEYHSNKFYVYKCLGRKQPRMLSFEEARDRIRKTLKQQKLKQKKLELVEQTKERHNALVDLEKLENLTIKI
jgi:parvulin-like peptidyl-prolyl isomerase